MELELIVGLLSGPAAGVGVSVFFLHKFMQHQKDVTDRLVHEMKEDRRMFQDTITKLDTRLSYIETLIEHFCKEKR